MSRLLRSESYSVVQSSLHRVGIFLRSVRICPAKTNPAKKVRSSRPTGRFSSTLRVRRKSGCGWRKLIIHSSLSPHDSVPCGTRAWRRRKTPALLLCNSALIDDSRLGMLLNGRSGGFMQRLGQSPGGLVFCIVQLWRMRNTKKKTICRNFTRRPLPGRRRSSKHTKWAKWYLYKQTTML